MAFQTLNSPNAVSTSDSQLSLTTSYQVDGSNNDVQISLVFGPVGVAATSQIKLDDNVLAAAQVGSVNNFSIGANQAISGKFLTIYSIVTVTNATPVPANLTVDFSINGGVNSYSHSLSYTENNAGGSALFLIDIFLYS
ncbi:MAG TPA: hypothetical protein VHE59_19325 [Mucilaginibacter sp.]|nr:hypothetical protein [Mucilaginibacter sp.]